MNTPLLHHLHLAPEVEQIATALLNPENPATGHRLTDDEALTLMRQAPIALLGTLAVARKRQVSGNEVYYNRNIHIEPTNICVFRCRFCSYRRGAGEPDAWYHDLDAVEQLAAERRGEPITEVHIVGGVHPEHDLDYYCEMIRRVKKQLPHVAVKAYTAVELHYIISKAGLTLAEGLQRLKEAGMEAIPGGGAEIFAPEIRERICPEKPTAEEWLATHEAAHGLGISTNCTILYGHIESYEHRIDHLRRLRELQDRTHGFDAFIPLKYRNLHNSMSAVGEVSLPEDMKMMALSRLYLDNIPHIKAYWPMLGIGATELALSFGADDIDGTIDDTTKIYSMAGAEDQRPRLSTERMENLVRAAGFEPVERDTFYRPVKH
ncbi:CofH family radical SAM protein [uncultured Rikenella sp.]|uniref:radical SAM protein n=1 Tax=uncultured Rikenella sp. TaxID=368003 RepID=UPI0026369689|nr:CofH family radical SAM protein [uncultured Rikenella sp.]